MRLAVSYLASAAIHLGAYALLAICLPLIQLSTHMRVATGKPISLVMVLPAVASEEADVAPPVEMEVAATSELPSEPNPPAVPLDQQPPMTVEANPTELAEQQLPIATESTEITRAEVPLEPPPTQSLDKPLVKQQKSNEASLASTSVPFQAETELGLDVEQLPAKLPTNPPPLYPSDALTAKVEGRVVLRVQVSAEGKVTSIKLETSSGNELLDRSATAAVEKWLFEPARRQGTAIPFEILVPVTFQIVKK